MKKVYIIPQSQEIKMKLESMIAASLGADGNVSVDTSDDSNLLNNKKGFPWDEYMKD